MSDNINVLEGSAPQQRASFYLLRRTEGPFRPKGDSGGQTAEQTDKQTDNRFRGLDMICYF